MHSLVSLLGCFWQLGFKKDNMGCNLSSIVMLHAMQIAWANSARVGCGAYKCGKAVGFPYPDSTIFVCNYGPG